jgi:ribosomal protein L14
MLYKGSFLKTKDNSGIISVYILRKQKKNAKIVKVTISDIVQCVVFEVNILKKKLKHKKKDFIFGVVVTVRKKYSKKNGLYIRFSENTLIPLKITRFIVPLANRVWASTYYELKYLKKFKSVFKTCDYFY